MLKALHNECRVVLDVIAEDPLLVKSGVVTISGPDMAFVETYRNGRREPYLPGSSLKGVLRSHSERIARSLKLGSACNPFATDERVASPEDLFCGSRLRQLEAKDKKQLPPNEIYKRSCVICKLFGSTHFVGRFGISDAYLQHGQAARVPRDGVGIDRFTGGASSGAKFDLEVVAPGTTFQTKIYLRNFELWQLGLLAFLIQDFKDGLLWVGSGKSRGFGRVKGQVQDVTVSYIGFKPPYRENDKKVDLWGISHALSDRGGAYGYLQETPAPVPCRPPAKGLRDSYTWTKTATDDVWAAVADYWPNFLLSPEMVRNIEERGANCG